MNGRKSFKTSRHSNKHFSLRPKAFIFIDKKTGTTRFEVKADAGGSLPGDEAVSLLVMQCLMRNQMPDEFAVMVPAGENLLDGLRQRARKLIHACTVIEASIQLTVRQKEVLRGIQQILSNKAIGMKLNLSERTVKFHVSGLLAKFNVNGRMGLMHKANDLLSAVNLHTRVEPPQLDAGEERGGGQEIRVSSGRLVHINALERRSRG
jgi:DNA-binding CsgD family transcriptional regulator